jgi:dephospho-CoA kinase
MLRIGLTGGIGSGKSTVANIFKVLGIPVFDADSEAKKLMEDNSSLIHAIKKEFGEECFVEGKLNRKYLAAIVFNNSSRLEKLNALVHPATLAWANEWAQQQTSPYVVKEAALMFESSASADMDVIVGVYAPQALRLRRAMQRDHISRDEVLARMNKQINEEIKMRLCDYVLVNDEQQLLFPQILQLHEKFLKMSNNKQETSK